MIDILKKTLLTGIGLAAMTKEKIEQLAKELIQKGKLSEKEGKELVNDLLAKSKEAKNDMETTIEKIIKKTLKNLNIATREDIAKLTKKVKQLDDKINKADI
ncbi:MAG: phasin family protein [Pseudomonadota bacterium]